MCHRNVPGASGERQIIGEEEDQGRPGSQREADKKVDLQDPEELLPLPPNSVTLRWVTHQNLSELSESGELASESADTSPCSDWLQQIPTWKADPKVIR